MKKILSFILALMLILPFCLTAFAADVTVSAEDVHLITEEATLIPVNLSGNSGIMGFRITVEYPVESVEIKSVSRGEITAKGNFNTNFGINDGKFDVLWNNTENITNDGSLFVISAQSKATITKDTEIKISFSQPDTFNESYQDVVLDCHNITISADEVETTQPTSVNDEDAVTNPSPNPVDSSQVVDAVKMALDKFGYKSLSEVTDEQQFIDEVNKNLETLTGTSSHSVSDMESLKSLYTSAYEGQFVAETTNNIDPDKLHSAIDKALETVGAKSIDNIAEKDKAKLVAEVEKNLKAEDADVPSISEDIGTDEAIDIIEKIYNSTSANDEASSEESTENANYTLIIVVCAIALCLVIGAILFIRKRKRTSKNKLS